MSWLSELTGIHISAPAPIQHLGDAVAGFVVNNVPGGGIVNGLFNLTNNGAQPQGPTPQQLYNQTLQNVQSNVQTGVAAANTAAIIQQQTGTAGTGLQLLLGTPVGLVGVAVVLLLVFLIARRK